MNFSLKITVIHHMIMTNEVHALVHPFCSPEEVGPSVWENHCVVAVMLQNKRQAPSRHLVFRYYSKHILYTTTNHNHTTENGTTNHTPPYVCVYISFLSTVSRIIENVPMRPYTRVFVFASRIFISFYQRNIIWRSTMIRIDCWLLFLVWYK